MQRMDKQGKAETMDLQIDEIKPKYICGCVEVVDGNAYVMLRYSHDFCSMGMSCIVGQSQGQGHSWRRH